MKEERRMKKKEIKEKSNAKQSHRGGKMGLLDSGKIDTSSSMIDKKERGGL